MTSLYHHQTIMWKDFCYDLLSCWEIILYILMVIFFSGPLLAIKNMDILWYQIILGIIVLLWIIYFFIQRIFPKVSSLLWWRIVGIIIFWFFTGLFFRTWWPIPARELPSCWFCWSDYPPYSALPLTIVNILTTQILWIALAYKFKRQKKNRALVILSIITLFITLQWFAFLALLFD